MKYQWFVKRYGHIHLRSIIYSNTRLPTFIRSFPVVREGFSAITDKFRPLLFVSLQIIDNIMTFGRRISASIILLVGTTGVLGYRSDSSTKNGLGKISTASLEEPQEEKFLRFSATDENLFADSSSGEADKIEAYLGKKIESAKQTKQSSHDSQHIEVNTIDNSYLSKYRNVPATEVLSARLNNNAESDSSILKGSTSLFEKLNQHSSEGSEESESLNTINSSDSASSDQIHGIGEEIVNAETWGKSEAPSGEPHVDFGTPTDLPIKDMETGTLEIMFDYYYHDQIHRLKFGLKVGLYYIDLQMLVERHTQSLEYIFNNTEIAVSQNCVQ